MKKFILLASLMISSSLFASDGFEVLKSIGNVYDKQSGECARHLDIMKWYDFETRGTISFALTDRPLIRPLTGYQLSATISAPDLLPLGQGTYESQPNQPVPLKSEYKIEANGDLSLYFHHFGKGSMGGIIFDTPGYAKQNHKLEYFFSARNASGIFEKLELTYRDLKGLVPKKKVFCSFTLAQ